MTRIDFNKDFEWAHGPRWQQADLLRQDGIVFCWDEMAIRYVPTDRTGDGIEWHATTPLPSQDVGG